MIVYLMLGAGFVVAFVVLGVLCWAWLGAQLALTRADDEAAGRRR